MNYPTLLRQLEEHEGFVPHAYEDSLGYLSIGLGTMIDSRKGGGITREQAGWLAMDDLAEVAAGLDAAIPWWVKLNEVRQHVLMDMGYQLGVSGLLRFRRTLAAVRDGDWDAAWRGMLASRWAQQTPRRARRLAAMMRTGLPVALEDV